MADENLTFCVCAYNASRTLADCLGSIAKVASGSRIVVVDHHSEDDTARIAKTFGAEVVFESNGLGYARQLCFRLANTRFVVFVDADVEIVRQDFLSIGREVLRKREFGAVVGLALGHRFAYGLPASLLMLRKADFEGEVIPRNVEGRETHFIQRRLDALKLNTFYVYHAILHRSEQRKFMPEYQGAYTRLLPSPALKEIPFSLQVIALRALNSKNAKNILYVPIFFGKFLRGFANPERWVRKRSAKVVQEH
ncbi:MAG: glycosyltransferase family 2 protein [Nitrososphaerales archaeon]